MWIFLTCDLRNPFAWIVLLLVLLVVLLTLFLIVLLIVLVTLIVVGALPLHVLWTTAFGSYESRNPFPLKERCLEKFP